MRKACESYERAGEWYAQEDAQAYVASCSHVYSLTECSLEPRMLASRMLRICTQTLRNTRRRLLDTSRWQTVPCHQL